MPESDTEGIVVAEVSLSGDLITVVCEVAGSKVTLEAPRHKLGIMDALVLCATAPRALMSAYVKDTDDPAALQTYAMFNTLIEEEFTPRGFDVLKEVPEPQ